VGFVRAVPLTRLLWLDETAVIVVVSWPVAEKETSQKMLAERFDGLRLSTARAFLNAERSNQDSTVRARSKKLAQNS